MPSKHGKAKRKKPMPRKMTSALPEALRKQNERQVNPNCDRAGLDNMLKGQCKLPAGQEFCILANGALGMDGQQTPVKERVRESERLKRYRDDLHSGKRTISKHVCIQYWFGSNGMGHASKLSQRQKVQTNLRLSEKQTQTEAKQIRPKAKDTFAKHNPIYKDGKYVLQPGMVNNKRGST